MENNNYFVPENSSNSTSIDIENDGESCGSLIALISILQVQCILITIDNILTLIVFSQKNMQSISYTYMSMLAAVEIIQVCGFSIRFIYEMVKKFNGHSYILIWFTSHLFLYLALNGLSLSFLATFCISKERYLAICYPLKAKTFQNQLFARKLIIALVCVTSIYHIPLMFVNYVDTSINKVSKEIQYSLQKNKNITSSIYFAIYQNLREILFRFIPAIVILYMNIRSIVAFRKARQKRKTISQNSRKLLEDWQLFIIQISIAASYTLLAIMGSLNMFLVEIFGSGMKPKALCYITWVLEINVPYSSFFLHFIFNSKFRRTFKRMFCFKKGNIEPQGSFQNSINTFNNSANILQNSVNILR